MITICSLIFIVSISINNPFSFSAPLFLSWCSFYSSPLFSLTLSISLSLSSLLIHLSVCDHGQSTSKKSECAYAVMWSRGKRDFPTYTFNTVSLSLMVLYDQLSHHYFWVVNSYLSRIYHCHILPKWNPRVFIFISLAFRWLQSYIYSLFFFGWCSVGLPSLLCTVFIGLNYETAMSL